jgi:phage terminase large subunit GpA-like protein
MKHDPYARLRRDAMQVLRPPAKIALSDWVERNVFLPSSIAAQPGRMRLWPHQRQIADSIGDPAVERVSVLKSVRVGYTQLLSAAIGHFAVNDPSPILVVVPAEQDARDLMTGNIEPTFSESPLLRAALKADDGGRDTLFQRRFPGGSLKLVSARAPRNLRGHTARVLLLDEVDGFEISAGGEGDPVTLAERRTLSYGDRKIVLGSTPVDEATSRVLRAYEASDGRVYECACPSCGALTEVLWKHIEWKPGQPETAAFRCPHCDALVDERHKPGMIRDGGWRITRPDVLGHHGYRMNALISLLPNASWGRLAAEFLEAKRNPETLKAFTTTLLAEPWRDDGEELDESSLFNRREPFGLDRIPPEVLILSAGVDVQDDRLEMSTLGWTKDGDALVLGHEIVWGSPLHNESWAEMDDLLKRDFRHPLGGVLKIDAALVDSGSGGHTDAVYSFCRSRIGRRIFALKGVSGFQRPAVQPSGTRGIRLMLVGVDAVKSQLYARLSTGRTIRFSDTLDATWFEQLTGERRVVKYSRGHPVRRFERIPGRRVEALDCCVYAFAARQLVGLDMDRREAEVASVTGQSRRATVVRSKWLDN